MQTEQETKQLETYQKHAQLCAEAGSLQYRIEIMKEELAAKNALIKEINLKAAADQAADLELKKNSTAEPISSPEANR